MAKQVSMLLLSGTISAGTTDIVGSYANISGYKNVKIEAYSPVATNGTAYLLGTNVSQADQDPSGDPNIPWDASAALPSTISSVQPNNVAQIKEGAIYGVQCEWVRGFFQLSAPIGLNAPVYIILTARS
jgi:hypothetical protein